MESWSFTTTQEISDVLAMIKLLLISKTELDTLETQTTDGNVLRRDWQILLSRLKVSYATRQTQLESTSCTCIKAKSSLTHPV
jgi:hypothetical protein